MNKKILVADDEECIRYTFYDFLNGGGYHVETTDTLSGCMKKIQEKPFDLLFLDIGLGRDNGLDAIERIKVLQPNCEVVIITGSLNSTAIQFLDGLFIPQPSADGPLFQKPISKELPPQSYPHRHHPYSPYQPVQWS